MIINEMVKLNDEEQIAFDYFFKDKETAKNEKAVGDFYRLGYGSWKTTPKYEKYLKYYRTKPAMVGGMVIEFNLIDKTVEKWEYAPTTTDGKRTTKRQLLDFTELEKQVIRKRKIELGWETMEEEETTDSDLLKPVYDAIDNGEILQPVEIEIKDEEPKRITLWEAIKKGMKGEII